MTPTNAQLGQDALEAVRELSRRHGCRIEISSDGEGMLGKFCCCASDPERHHQGFGPTPDAAVKAFHAKGGRK